MLLSLRSAKHLLFAVCLLLLAAAFSFAQITNVTDQTSTPVPGAGHDYFKMFSETTNPANGSVSLRIQLPVPPGRQLALPFAIAYDSNGVLFFQALANATGGWSSDQRVFAQGGWQLTVPMMSDVHTQRVAGLYGQFICEYYTGYVFYDAKGVRHPMPLAYVPSPGSAGCTNQTKQLFSYTSGYDEFDQATWSNFDQIVYEPDGTKYSFSQLDGNMSTGSYSALPVSVEDRNGNMLNFTWSVGSTSFTMTDTLGRTGLSVSNFGTSNGTVAVSGLGAYTLQWTTVSPNYSVYANPISGNSGCGPVLPAQATLPVISSITLPNQQAYTFQYNSTYGRVSQITYPSGGWIKYTWGLTDTLSEAVVYANTSGVDQGCQFQIYAPVIRSREVSFDGQNVALTQTFTYKTTWSTNPQFEWTGKKTTVTTTDNLRNLSSTTTYTYNPWYAPQPPNETSILYEQIPTENVITYSDWGGSSTISTVNKGWAGGWADLLTSEQVTPDGGGTSQTNYSYAAFGQVKEKDEYDYAASPPGPLLRKTIINYWNSPPIYDRPSQIITCDALPCSSSQNRVAETDYVYDASSLASGHTTVGRDLNYNGNGIVSRGNATSKSEWVNTSGNSLTWNYTYDDTGQQVTMSDPKSNGTTYSFADAFPACGPAGANTNAYLTLITDAKGFTQKFDYRYCDGQLNSATDRNGQKTSYSYADSLNRLTEISYPDTGQTSYTYTSVCGQPATTTIFLGGGSNYTESATFDGVCHVTDNAITSDSPPDYTDTTYDGTGKVWTVSNPYNSKSDPTYGLTTYTYDALGRASDEGGAKSIAYADGSATSTTHSATSTTDCSTVTDPASKARTLCSDGLGRVTSVTEDPGGLNYSTTYAYNTLDDLTTVTQGSQTRTFVYDSLARLTKATNPESGVTSYTYPSGGSRHL